MKLKVDTEYYFMPLYQGNVGGLVEQKTDHEMIFEKEYKFSSTVVFMNPSLPQYAAFDVNTPVALFFITRNMFPGETIMPKKTPLTAKFLYNEEGQDEYKLYPVEKFEDRDDIVQRGMFHVIPTENEHAFYFANTIDKQKGNKGEDYYDQLQLMNLNLHTNNNAVWLEASSNEGRNVPVFLSPVPQGASSKNGPINDVYPAVVPSNPRDTIKMTHDVSTYGEIEHYYEYVPIAVMYVVVVIVVLVMFRFAALTGSAGKAMENMG